MIEVPFWKVESVGNDFVLIHEDDAKRLAEGDFVAFIRHLTIKSSERKFGVGSDGLLLVTPRGQDLDLRMFNPDGSEDFCGNGLRCAAVHATNQGWVGEQFVIHHHGHDVAATVCGDDCVETRLDPATYDPESVPVYFREAPEQTFDRRPIWSGLDLPASSLSTGSTHTIIWAGRLPGDEEFLRLGPLIENDPQFPERTSAIWTEEVAPMRLRLRIWERGAGETLGCGTGASAAAVDYLRRTGRSGTVEVASKGGTLEVSAASWDAPLTVRGIAKDIYRGIFLLKD